MGHLVLKMFSLVVGFRHLSNPEDNVPVLQHFLALQYLLSLQDLPKTLQKSLKLTDIMELYSFFYYGQVLK